MAPLAAAAITAATAFLAPTHPVLDNSCLLLLYCRRTPMLRVGAVTPRALRVCSFAAGRMGGGGRCYIRGEAPLPFLNPGNSSYSRTCLARAPRCAENMGVKTKMHMLSSV